MYKKVMKNNKGVTLLALTIYIIIFVIVIAIMTTITTSFYGNISGIIDSPQYLSEFNSFVMFFAVDIKNYKEATVTNNSIVFENGPTYYYQDNIIYRNNEAIAKYIMDCTFTSGQYNVNTTTKNLINVNMQIGKDEDDSVLKNITFTLKYW